MPVKIPIAPAMKANLSIAPTVKVTPLSIATRLGMASKKPIHVPKRHMFKDCPSCPSDAYLRRPFRHYHHDKVVYTYTGHCWNEHTYYPIMCLSKDLAFTPGKVSFHIRVFLACSPFLVLSHEQNTLPKRWQILCLGKYVCPVPVS